MSRTILLVHGNFVTNHSWDRWIDRYRARGFDVVAPAYPLRDRPVADLKKDRSNPALGALGLPEVLEHMVGVVRGLAEEPIIVGHSFGGLLTQLLMDRDLGVAGVAIDSVPPQGVPPLEWSFFRGTWPIVNPFIPASRPYYMTFRQFQYTFGNNLTEAEQRAGYDRDIVPESRRLARGGLSRAARVDFRRRRRPLLLIGGSEDTIMPAAINRRNYRRYSGPSVTEYKEFPGRSHYSVIAGKGWEEVADYALDWALRAIGQAGPSMEAPVAERRPSP